MRFDAIQSNFTAGEVSPKFWGRIDLEKYFAGLATLENMIVQPYGGVIRRGGTHYIAEVKDSTKITVLVEFNYKNTHAYILEFGENYIRVYVDRTQVQDGGSPYEITTTYTVAEVADLRFCQDTDTLYITHKDHPPAKLTRSAHNNWILADIIFTFDYTYAHKWDAKTAQPGNWHDICWSPELELFAAVATGVPSANRVMTSSDGINWTLRTPGANNSWRAICWSPELGLFCAVSATGTNNRVMTSPDGITWTSQTSSANTSWAAICWSPELTLFVAVCSGTSVNVMTSPDGITWTNRTSAEYRGWTAVCWSPELHLFVAVADSGINDRVMTSPDGINWTIRVSAADNDWRSVCWNPDLRMFVAVASTGTGNRVMTSFDGLNWTCRITEDNDWRSICWSSEIDLFVATARTGTGNRVMTSSDGITWTNRTSAADNEWYGVCWSPKLFLFAAVANETIGASIMLSVVSMISAWKANDYPSLNWFYEQRHFFAAIPSKPNGIWASQSADYANMQLGTGLDNEALHFVIKAAYKFLWASAGQEIILGGSNAEFKLSANALNEAITPTNIRPVLQTNYGSIFLPSIRVDDSVVFVQKGERTFRRLASNFQSGSYSDSYKASNITILSEHIAKSGIQDIEYSTIPDFIIWACRKDGTLIGLTYEPEHKVFGWHRHNIGGKVKSLAVAKAVEGSTKDEVWAIVERTINGSTVQYIEYMIEGLSDEDNIEDAFFVDSGITKTGSQFTVVTGLDHLEGEEVQILGDGLVQTSKIATGGSVTLETAVDKVQVGLVYSSILETLPIEGGNPIGISQSLIKRVKSVSLRLHRSLGLKIGDVFGNMDTYPFSSTSLFTGDTDPMPFAGGYDRQSQVRIIQENPLPLEIQAIMYQARTQ